MHEQVKIWTDRARSSRLPRPLVWTSLTTGILRQLSFPLAATTFTKQECDGLLTPLLAVALPAAGLNRNFPRAILHGPKEQQGFELPHPYVEQGIAHMQRLVECPLRDNSITGQLLRASVEQLQLELGSSTQLFALKHSIWSGLATECLATCFWKFLDTYQIGFHVPQPTIPLQCHGDGMIMDLLVRQTQDTVRLGRANRCRLYLQAPRVSDIVSCCGQYLRASVIQRRAEPRKGPVKLGWPRQGNPSEADWATWENLLRDALGINNAFHKLATRLGRWTMDWQDWEWYVSNDHQILVQMEHSSGTAHLRYHIPDSRQVRYAPIPQRSIHYGQLRKLFPLVQVDIGRLESNNFYIERQAPLNMQWESDGPWKLPACPLLNQQFIDFTNQTAWAFQFNFGQQSIDGLMQLAASLSQGTVDACSDGSAKDGEGSTSWIMMYNGTAMSAGFKVPGAADTQDSYRNELAGLYAVVYVTRRVISLFHLQRARIEVACDGESALDRVFGNPKPTSMTDNHWDMVELIKDELTLCPQLALEWRHVYGHQDEKNHKNKKGSPTESFRRQPLDKWARMNIQVDMQATFCRETPGSPVVLPGYERLWRPTINQATIVQKVVQQVRRHCHSPQAKAYWTDKGRIGSSTPDDIDWHATGQAMLATSVNRTRFVIKAATGWCAVNRNMVRWKFDVVATKCVLCKFFNKRFILEDSN